MKYPQKARILICGIFILICCAMEVTAQVTYPDTVITKKDTLIHISADSIIVRSKKGEQKTMIKDETKRSKWKKAEKAFAPDSSKNFSIIALPVVTYTPETSLSLGATVQTFFRPKKAPKNALSSVFLGGYYTLNKQYQFFTKYEIFLKENKIWFDGEFKYQDWLEEFYGIGNETPYENREFTYDQQWYWDFRFLYRIRKFYFGPQLKVSRLWNTSYASDSTLLATTDVTGKNGYKTFGMGVVFAWNTRDNNIYPYKGYYISVSNFNHPEWRSDANGEDLRFFNLEVDYRHFFSPRKGKHVIAIQGYISANWGDPPFRLTSLHGGTYHGRGYYEGRYRDRHLWSAQFEWRFPIWWRLKGALHTSVGDVAHEASDWSFNTIKWTIGGGIRFIMNAKERTSIRVDFARGLDKSKTKNKGVYFGTNEVF